MIETSLIIIPSLFLSLAMTGNTPQTRQATHYATLAYYKQSGIGEAIDPHLKKFETKYIPEPLQKVGIGVTFLYRVAVDSKIELSWSF